VSIRFYSALTKTAPFKSINQSINQFLYWTSLTNAVTVHRTTV